MFKNYALPFFSSIFFFLFQYSSYALDLEILSQDNIQQALDAIEENTDSIELLIDPITKKGILYSHTSLQEVHLFNTLGIKMRTENTVPTSENTFTFSLVGLPNGIYLIHIIDKQSRIVTKKFIL